MHTPSLGTPTQPHRAWTPLVGARFPANVRACFARVRERFGTAHDPAWAFTSQPEHLLAYAAWSEAHPAPEAIADGACVERSKR